MRNFKRRAFTLIEILIVIAIISILFIVLVSKVDTSITKANATGVQADFRSIQVAIETVATKYGNFNAFGWDMGDLNGNRIRDFVDVGDTNKNGIKDDDETWYGQKRYLEFWTGIYTLVNPSDPTDNSAVEELELAINHYLSPKLHISIATDGVITMKNGYTDPWGNEYHGKYITNASPEAAAKFNSNINVQNAGDGLDRGAIILLCNGENTYSNTNLVMENGVVKTINTISDKLGNDDYMSAIVCSYANGYGQLGTQSSGFGNDFNFANSGGSCNPVPIQRIRYNMLTGDYKIITETDTKLSCDAEFSKFIEIRIDDKVVDANNYTVESGSTVVHLKSSYIETLEKRPHFFEIISTDGWADCVIDFSAHHNFGNINNETNNEDEPVISKMTLDDYSWEQIKELASMNLSAEEYERYWNIKLGDTKTDDKYTYILVDFDGNNYHGFVFMFYTHLKTCMNQSETNSGGYCNSDLAKNYINNLYLDFNDDLKSVVKRVAVECKTGTDNQKVLTYDFYTFVPAAAEIFGRPYGTLSNHYFAEGSVFDYFDSYAAICDLLGDDKYWLRSASWDDTKSFQYVCYGINAPCLASTELRIFACFVVGD